MTAKTDKPQFVIGERYRLGDLPFWSKYTAADGKTYMRVDSPADAISSQYVVTLISLPADQVEAESKPCPDCGSTLPMHPITKAARMDECETCGNIHGAAPQPAEGAQS